MTLKECYDALHGDYSDVIDRLESERLINKYLFKFPNDSSMETLRQAVADNDKEMAFRAVHTLKGVAANISLTQLYHSASDLTEQLRDGVNQPDPVLFKKVEDDYELVTEVIREYMCSNY